MSHTEQIENEVPRSKLLEQTIQNCLDAGILKPEEELSMFIHLNNMATPELAANLIVSSQLLEQCRK